VNTKDENPIVMEDIISCQNSECSWQLGAMTCPHAVTYIHMDLSFGNNENVHS
jgi:hypothetical protein